MANFLSHDGSRSFASSTKRCVQLFLITLCIGNILVHEASAAVCTDRRKTIKLKGKVQQFCKWCAEDPGTRCTKIKIKKIKKKKNGRGKKKKKKRILYNPKNLCPCTCADYLEDPPTEAPFDPSTEAPFDGPGEETIDGSDDATREIKDCPVDLEIVFMSSRSDTSRSSVHNTQISCMRDGYQRGQVCMSNWYWRGCRYNKLDCQPHLVCTCAPGELDVWSCYPHAIETCEPRERPDYVPEETGGVCQEGETPPEPPPGFPEEPPPSDDDACPTEQYMNDGLVSGVKPPCTTDTYQEGQVCSYNLKWRGCRYTELYCGAGLVCECQKNPDSDLSGRESWSWSCYPMTHETCEERERPGADGITPPYYVPEEAGDVCFEGQDPPEAPPGFDTGVDDETLLIRRRLRQ